MWVPFCLAGQVFSDTWQEKKGDNHTAQTAGSRESSAWYTQQWGGRWLLGKEGAIFSLVPHGGGGKVGNEDPQPPDAPGAG